MPLPYETLTLRTRDRSRWRDCGSRPPISGGRRGMDEAGAGDGTGSGALVACRDHDAGITLWPFIRYVLYLCLPTLMVLMLVCCSWCWRLCRRCSFWSFWSFCSSLYIYIYLSDAPHTHTQAHSRAHVCGQRHKKCSVLGNCSRLGAGR